MIQNQKEVITKIMFIYDVNEFEAQLIYNNIQKIISLDEPQMSKEEREKQDEHQSKKTHS